MNPHTTPQARRGQHPLLILAALAVILFCAIGTAAIMGWLPSSKGGNTRNGLSEAERAALSASLQQPGQPGVATPGVATPVVVTPGVATPAVAAQGYMAPGALPPAYPAQPVAGAYVAAPAPTAPLPAAPAATYAQGYADNGSAAYGRSAQGSTASGYAEPKASTSTRVAREESASRWCANCGNVESIRTITTRAQGSGLGAAGGAILGGLLGNQVGGGHGRQLATVAGAVGGAVMGNQVEGNMKANHSYEIRVRLDDGTLRTFHQQSVPRWHTGDRVRIVKGALRTA
jgi:outer membrane lipoprotein SlyB